MDMDGVQKRRGQVVFVGSKGSGKSSLYQSLKLPNPQVIDIPSCGVLVEEWRPFDLEASPVAEECRKFLDQIVTEDDFKATVQVWDICGSESLRTCQQLCIHKGALFVLVFNVRRQQEAKLVPQWVQMIQAKSPGASIIIAASNCEVSEDDCQDVLKEVENMESVVIGRILEELTALRELKSEVWVKSCVEKLKKIAQNRPNIHSTVFVTSAVTGKGVSDLRCAILKLLFDVEKFPYVNQVLSDKELNLFGKVRSSHDGKNVVMSLKHYQELASSVGLNDGDELEKATKILEMKGCLVRVNIAGTFREPETTIVITDPCCFVSACAMIHRDEENPQNFVNKLQKSRLVERFWPTSTRPNDWTLRSAIEDVVSRGMVRESFLPLCWQVWDVSEEDIKKLLSVMLKLGVLVDEAPKAGYEVELALAYFKNLSVTKRYQIPLQLKLPKDAPQGVWPEETPDSTVSVCWQYKFQEGFHDGLLLCILAACRNYKLNKTVLADWQGGVVARIGDVDIRILSNDHVFDLSARCKITNGNKQALNMAWATLAHFLYVTESYLSNFPGLHYQFLGPYNVLHPPKSIYQSIHDCITKTGSPVETLWILPPSDLSPKDNEFSIPADVLTFFKHLSGQSSVYVSHQNSQTEEVKLLASSLEEFGFEVAIQNPQEAVDRKLTIQRCSLVILFLTKSYLEDPSLNEDITIAQNNNKHIVAACFEPNLAKELADVVWVDLNRGSGNGVSHTFDPTQLSSLITECQTLLYGIGDILPLSPSLSEPLNERKPASFPVLSNGKLSEPLSTPSFAPNMEPSKPLQDVQNQKRLKKAEKKKRQVQFSVTASTDSSSENSQIRRLAACTVAATMVGAGAEHLSQTRKTSSAGVRAANATAKVAQAVANGDADAATKAMNDVVRIVDGLSSASKQKENGFGTPPKSKTCTIL